MSRKKLEPADVVPFGSTDPPGKTEFPPLQAASAAAEEIPEKKSRREIRLFIFHTPQADADTKMLARVCENAVM
jgi:hypothetical protein